MSPSSGDHVFAGAIPKFYQEQLVPLIFEPYAADLAARAAQRHPLHVLELAAGTGALTRHLARVLPPASAIVATDLNPAMLEQAAAFGTARRVEWQQADACELPFANESFDLVVCQFGVMFFPDKPKAFSEAHRVLRPGGGLLFNVWDRLRDNELSDAVTQALAAVFPDDPPRFLARVPHGYCDPTAIARDVALGGFERGPGIETLSVRGHAASARVPAVAFCQGTPLRGEIEARGGTGLAEATDAAEAAIARRFGPGPLDAKLQALVIAAERV
jgi:SAM-dependent methyltransferase